MKQGFVLNGNLTDVFSCLGLVCVQYCVLCNRLLLYFFIGFVIINRFKSFVKLNIICCFVLNGNLMYSM